MKTVKRVFDFLEIIQNSNNKGTIVAGKENGSWRKYDINEFTENVNNLSKALISEGIRKGDKIAIMSGNRPEWNFVDFASNQIGAAIVPLYPTLSNKDLSYIISEAEVKLIFVSSEELYNKTSIALKAHNLDVKIYTFDKLEGHTHFNKLIELGKTLDTDLQPFREAITEDDLLTLIYTSGTTGTPKGVFLTHKNLISNVSAVSHLLTDEYRVALSFLPLSHIFERMVVYLYFSKAVEIYYTENLDDIVGDINDVRPNVFTTVPRVLEKVYDKIVAKGKSLSGIQKAIFFWALELGHKFQEPPKNGLFYNIKLAIARKLIFSKWKQALGNEVKIIISGGAALQERLGRVFWAADIKVLEGYGLTETSPVIAVNSWDDQGVRFGTVGQVLSNLEVKIADDGEVLVKGPSITPGYYKNDQATKDIFDDEGFLHTGDIGELSSDNFLKITDRKKEIFKTAGGKYVAPQVLENKLMESLVIGQVMVVGENERFPAALIVPAIEELQKWADHKGISYTNKLDLLSKSEVIDKYQREVDTANDGLGQWEKVKKFVLLPEEWSIDGGELTPKLSLKRKVILQKFDTVIREIYN